MSAQFEGLIILACTIAVILWHLTSTKHSYQRKDWLHAAGYLFLSSILILLLAVFVGFTLSNNRGTEILLLNEQRYGLNLVIGIGYGTLFVSAICVVLSQIAKMDVRKGN